ncbi:hypothetical protein HAX54_003512 [Datura stramonium]|uniref:DUF3444 domain-containing protein n=1 Tax=Datura stramonium TaxID=4076 RepID=A0ABS8RTJ4_DATST|nr:hypothetical protein [Datura stramonium]
MVNELAAKGGSSRQGNIHGNEDGVLKAERVAVVGSNKPRSSRELSHLEIQNMLMKKARMEITKKLKEWSTTAASRTSSKKERKEVEDEANCSSSYQNDLRRDKTAHDAVVDSKILRGQEKLPVFSAPVDLEPEAKSMTVPDPDFHNFDEDRTEKSFDDNQVWAAYDNEDGMTRYYALIQHVISRKPFKVQLSWLNSKNNSELGPINWVGSNFLKTSGDFRMSSVAINKTLKLLSPTRSSQEAPNALTGCWELDPAALPLELLRVMTDAEIEAQRERSAGHFKHQEGHVVKAKRRRSPIWLATAM